ncbi:MAG: insulinase family protein [Planctomycetes bacterium]|nr:insulinase family protein [Planctomycetota bacterium]
MRSLVRVTCLVALLLLAGSAGAVDLNAPLPVDPKVKMGQLPNGMNYWIRQHATPPGKLGMWLHVGSGSLNESDEQRGLAHFLEHMAFNGSENFPPGSLVKFFEGMGMRFGADQNAFTSFDETTYILALPNTEPETINKGLTYFADVAFRLSLLPEEIEKERGVVLEEMRARKGAAQRLLDKRLPVMLPGSLVPKRVPIGVEETLKAANQERFKDYYSAYYRPDNSTLIVVGDADPAALEKLIADHFSGWKKPETIRPNADPAIQPYTDTRVGIFTDPEQVMGEVAVISIRPKTETKTVGDFRAELVRDVGSWIFNRRMAEMVQTGKAPFMGAGSGGGNFLNVCLYLAAQAVGNPDKWPVMFETLLVELKRARVHGFIEQELEDARKSTLSSAEQAVRTEGTQDAHNFLGRMNGDLGEGTKPMSAAQRLELLQALLPGLTAEEVSKGFAQDFDGKNILVSITLPEKAELAVPTEAQVRELVAKAEATEVAGKAAKERPKSLLEKDPTPGKIASQEEDAELGILSVTFENGVRVHFRSMDFKKDQVTCRITLGGGLIHEKPENRGVTDVAALAFQQAATAKLDSTTIRDLMTGKNVGAGGGAGRDHFALTVGGSPADLEEGFRLAYLLLTEPKIEESALKNWRDRTKQMLEKHKTDVRGHMREKFRELLYSGDSRLKLIEPARVDALTMEAGQAWLAERLNGAYIEAAFVGDLPREKMVELAAKYLGSLPKRTATPADLEPLRKIEYPAGPKIETVKVETITPRAEVVMGWRVPDERAVHEFRMIEAAAEILQVRLREEIREKRALTYSTGCFADNGQMFREAGLLGVVFTADPEKVDEAAKIAREVVETFAKDGPTDEEIETAHKQFKTELEKSFQEPGTWLSILGDLDFRGNKLEYVKGYIAEMSGFTKEQLMETVKKYVVPERFTQVIGLPVVPPGAAPAPAPEAPKP